MQSTAWGRGTEEVLGWGHKFSTSPEGRWVALGPGDFIEDEVNKYKKCNVFLSIDAN